MLKYILIGIGAIIGLVVFIALTMPPPAPTAYYNSSGLWILSPVKINGTPYKVARIPVGNMSVVTGIEAGGRRYTYVVGYHISWLYYDSANGYAVVEIRNLGNATLYFGGVAIQSSARIRLKDPPLPPPPEVNVTATVRECAPDRCSVSMRIRLVAPYGGNVPINVILPQDVRSFTAQIGQDILTTFSTPYGSRVEVSTPWGSKYVEVRPNITAWVGGYNLTCRGDACTYTVRVYVASEVPAQVRLVADRTYGVSLVKTDDRPNTLAETYVDMELPPGKACISVLPTGQSVCVQLPYVPPTLLVRSIRWIYYSPTEVLAVLQLYNAGYESYRSAVYCDNCGPPNDDQQRVLYVLAYGATPLSSTLELRPLTYTVVAVRVASSGGALVLMKNNTRYSLAPPPLPRVHYSYNVSVMPGSPPGFSLYGWTITKYAVVSVSFDRPEVVYRNFVYTYAGNMTCPVSCLGQVCAAYIPLEAVRISDYAQQLNGWRIANSTARPAQAYVATPWGIIRIA